jgi:hypothetical protein
MHKKLNIIYKAINANQYNERHIFMEFFLRKRSAMDAILTEWRQLDDFPVYYLGKPEKVANCKDPSTGQIYWVDFRDILAIKQIKKGSEIGLTQQIIIPISDYLNYGLSLAYNDFNKAPEEQNKELDGFCNEANHRNGIFQYWEKRTFHKWRMKSGTTILICQDVINKLSSKDRRYLKIKD